MLDFQEHIIALRGANLSLTSLAGANLGIERHSSSTDFRCYQALAAQRFA